MTTVYEIIDRLREARGLSTRKLAQLAKLPPTTVESMMTRQPKWIGVARLEAIAAVFQLEWTDLFEPHRENAVIGTTILKVSSQIPEGHLEDILHHAMEKMPHGFSFSFSFNGKDSQSPNLAYHERNEEPLFLQSATAVLKRLNTEGLMEAMRRLLDISSDPRYCKKDGE